jgi:hypothetical protein
MCRNIKPLFNFEPPATQTEIQAASLQFVRKISGISKPSRANEAAFLAAVNAIAETAGTLLTTLETTSPARDRDVESAKARARSALRFQK